jgi:hypothetical protein
MDRAKYTPANDLGARSTTGTTQFAWKRGWRTIQDQRLDWLITLLLVYLVQFTFQYLFQVGGILQLPRPLGLIPTYLYVGWDAAYYRHFFAEAYDRFLWPPLYPFTLRLIQFLFRFHDLAFEKCAVILNLCSHGFIVWGISRYVAHDPDLDPTVGWIAAFLIFFFPGHNVFFAAYTESYYLAVTIGAFLLRQKRYLLGASVSAGVSALIRTMGSFLALAFFLEQVLICIRQRRVRWRPLFASAAGLIIVAGWNLGLRVVAGRTMIGEEAEWINELLRVHIPPGMNPKLWVLHYLTIGSPIDVVAFGISIIGIIYCFARRRDAEALYILIFYATLAFYIYRPFAWTRYVSVLFPLQLMVGRLLANRPRTTAATIAACAASACYIQLRLFQNQLGEP